jgi:hypothetical protein
MHVSNYNTPSVRLVKYIQVYEFIRTQNKIKIKNTKM